MGGAVAAHDTAGVVTQALQQDETDEVPVALAVGQEQQRRRSAGHGGVDDVLVQTVSLWSF